MRSWVEFWDRDHSIYVSDRHKAAHARVVGEGLAPYVPAGGAMLDYGCGEALHVPHMGGMPERLVLSDAGPAIRAGLEARFGGVAEVASPEAVAAMPDAAFDVIALVSVAQYLKPAEFDALLALFHRLLKPGGTVLIGDVVPPDVSKITDAAALLRFGLGEGFAVAAFTGLVRTALSDYGEVRAALGFSTFTAADMLARLAAAGFAGRRAARNIGHNQARMTFTGTKP
jgi:SAM-dependent methyltransferase